MRNIYLSITAILLLLSSCVTQHFVVTQTDPVTKRFSTSWKLLPSEITKDEPLPKGDRIKQVLVIVNDSSKEQYFVKMLNNGFPKFEFLGRNDFEAFAINKYDLSSGNTYEKIGLNILSKQTGDFLILTINFQATDRISNVTVEMSTAKTGRIFLDISRQAIGTDFTDLDGILVRPVLNGILEWLNKDGGES